MSKCEWKKILVDGEPDKYVSTVLRFLPCDKFDGTIDQDVYDFGRGTSICPYCRTDIRKPEEKPLIVKDGETKVKRENGQDFLLLNPYGEERYWLWKSFNEIIELTDEIAKLRPMVMCIREDIESSLKIQKLYAVDNYHCITSGDHSSSGFFRLATAHELQAQK